MHHTAEEKVEISRKVCEAYANDVVTIDSCAENQGISIRTFSNWCEEITEISEMYKAAQISQTDKYKRNLKAKCLSSLEKLVNGFEAEDVEQTDVPIYEKDADGKLVRIGVKTTSNNYELVAETDVNLIFKTK